MALKTLWYSQHDGYEKAISNPETMLFKTKKEADARDRQLDLAMNMAQFLSERVDTDNEALLEEIGIVIAENAKLVARGLKKPAALLETGDTAQKEDKEDGAAEQENQHNSRLDGDQDDHLFGVPDDESDTYSGATLDRTQREVG